jgi:hypothetical protein
VRQHDKTEQGRESPFHASSMGMSKWHTDGYAQELDRARRLSGTSISAAAVLCPVKRSPTV